MTGAPCQQLPPLEQKPRGPRRVLQKLWADKDLRDAVIDDLEGLLGKDAGAFSVTVRLDARESGTVAVTVVEAEREGSHRRPLGRLLTPYKKP